VGKKQDQPFQLSFNPSLRVDFQGSRVTSDGGLVMVRELDATSGWRNTARETLSVEWAEATGRSESARFLIRPRCEINNEGGYRGIQISMGIRSR
jgi:hypothetical protein